MFTHRQQIFDYMLSYHCPNTFIKFLESGLKQGIMLILLYSRQF